jgi:hypothetical protein
MAKDEKKEPEPKFFHPLHNKSIDNLLKEYQGFFTEENTLKEQQNRGHRRDMVYQGIVNHLRQHGVDEKTGKLNRYGYSDHKDKRKWTEDLLAKVLMPLIAEHYGESYAKSCIENHEVFRQYVERFMGQGEMSYNGIVEMLSESKNLKDGLFDDERISELFNNYLNVTSETNRKAKQYQEYLSDTDHYEKVLSFADKQVEPHKFMHKKGADVRMLFDTIKQSANKDYKPKKAKHLIPIPDKKK